MENGDTLFTKRNKIIIISLLVVIIGLLVFYLLLPSNKSKSSNDDYDSKYVNSTRTIMFYIVGSNLESKNGIASADIASIDYSKMDLENNNVLLYTGGTEHWWNFVSNNENAIYELTKEGFKKVESYQKYDMGSSDTLKEYLEYAYNNYKTDKYDLILYDHGGGIDGAIYDDFSGGHLELVDFKDALNASPFNKDNKLEFVLFRTCLNGTLEVADVFKDYADYMISSEEVTLGYRYSPVLGFISDIKPSKSPIKIGKEFISLYYKQLIDDDVMPLSATYSIIDLNKVDKVEELLNDFVSGIDIKKDFSNISKVRSSTYQYAYSMFDDSSNIYDAVDLYSFVKSLGKYSDKSNKELLSAIKDMVVYNRTNIDGSTGVSIYFPYNGYVMYQTKFLSVYNNLPNLKGYYNFIKSYRDYRANNSTQSYSNFAASTPSVNTKKREFTLTLTDEQIKNYAQSRYIIFQKNNDNTYTFIYSSDNVEIDGNKLTTKLSNNLIQVTDENNEKYYLPVYSSNNDKVKSSYLTVLDYDTSKDMSEWYSAVAQMYYSIKNNKIISTSIVGTTSKTNGSYAGAIFDEKDLTALDFPYSKYTITDANGKYTGKWDNGGKLQIIELYPGKYQLSISSLDDNKEYYAVFAVADIYGNLTYSNLIGIN